MTSVIRLLWVTLGCAFIFSSSYAEPLFTGPLLTEAAVTEPKGHWNLTLYNFSLSSHQIYDSRRQLVPIEPNSDIQMLPEFTYGLADNFDAVIEPVLIQNHLKNHTYTGFGDTTVMLGMQVLRQNEHKWRPDFRLLLEEILPSGRYNQLAEANQGVDALGIGSYQTAASLNFQHLLHLSGVHYLNAHASFTYLYASDVNLQGISTYGGNILTRGLVKPGSLFTLDLAEEFSLTEHWGAVIEAFIQYQQADRFIGEYGKSGRRLTPEVKKQLKNRIVEAFPTKRNIHSLFVDSLAIGNGDMNLFSLAPAIEYNFNEHYGLLIGSWFTFAGKNISSFAAFSAALTISY